MGPAGADRLRRDRIVRRDRPPPRPHQAASRAVGLANGSNPIPIVIPCHRVIGANGTLTGYAGGIERKQTLLELEQDALSERPTRISWACGNGTIARLQHIFGLGICCNRAIVPFSSPGRGTETRYSAAARRSDSDSRSAAASTAGACIRPGWRESRSSGPDTDTAAITLPGDLIGAETERRPPRARRPTAPSPAGGCRTARRRRRRRSGGPVHPLRVLPGSRICAAEPARIVSCQPTGMVSRRPEGRSAAATQTR